LTAWVFILNPSFIVLSLNRVRTIGDYREVQLH
jgi:hypothetical protein